MYRGMWNDEKANGENIKNARTDEKWRRETWANINNGVSSNVPISNEQLNVIVVAIARYFNRRYHRKVQFDSDFMQQLNAVCETDKKKKNKSNGEKCTNEWEMGEEKCPSIGLA